MPSPKTAPKNGKLHIKFLGKHTHWSWTFLRVYPCSHRHELHDHRRIRQMDAAGHIDFTRLWSVVLVRLDPIKKIDFHHLVHLDSTFFWGKLSVKELKHLCFTTETKWVPLKSADFTPRLELWYSTLPPVVRPKGQDLVPKRNFPNKLPG